MKAHTSLPLLALAALVAHGCTRAEAQTAARAANPPNEGRGPIELTVYAGDFGMVRDTRRVELAPGRVRVGLTGVSRSLDQNSVLFDWPQRKDTKVLSSTYDLGVGNSGRLLQRFLGKPVDLVYRGENGREGERVRGILEVVDPGNVVVKADGRYIVNPQAQIEAPADTGIVTIPQLSAEVESGAGGATDLTVAYMTTGLSWSADYTMTLAPDRDQLDLECWATVTNRTGTDYPDAKIRFVAGSPNRAVREPQMREQDYNADGIVAARAAAPMSEAKEMRPEAMGELVAYPYDASATIRQDQMNRVRMMEGERVTVKRVYSVAMPYLSRDYSAIGNGDDRLGATLGINFANAKGIGLGMPLPAGTVRVYEPDAGGAARYVGAASIGDTPKDARVSLELSKVVNVYARARQVSAQRVDKKHTRRTVEVVVSNEKAGPVDVRIVQPLGEAWRIDAGSEKGRRLNLSTNEWTVRVPAGGETKLRYSVTLGPV